MKKLYSAGKRVLFSIAFVIPSLASAQWAYVGSPGFSTAVGTYQSIEVGSDGSVYVAYCDQGVNGGRGVVMKYDGTSWAPVGPLGFTAGLAENGSLAIGPGDTLYFAYQDGGGGTATVMKFNGTAWVPIGTGISAGSATYNSMAVDNSGTPYLAFTDAGTGTKVVVKRFDGSGWVSVGAPGGISMGGSSYVSLELDSQGFPWVAFSDASVSNNATVMKYNGTAWDTVGVRGFTGSLSGVLNVDLALDGTDVPYVVFWNPLNGLKAGVKKFNGITWDTVGTPGISAGQSNFTSIVIDADGKPYISYMDFSTPGSAASSLGYDAGSGTWNYIGAQGFSGSGPGYLNSAIDGNSTLYVTFVDGSNGNRTSVMKYQLCTPGTPLINAPASVCEGDSATLTVAGNLNNDTQWTWYTGSCKGTIAGTGNSLPTLISDTITYYVESDGRCVFAADSCAMVTVNALNTPDISIAVTDTTDLEAIPGTGVLFQWYFNGMPLTGATQSTYTATQTGTYTVVAVNAQGCYDRDSVFVNISLAGNDELKPELFSLYPVPVADVLNISAITAVTDNWTLSITDMQGRVVFRLAVPQPSGSFDLSHLSPGVYCATLESESGKHIQRIVKQ